MPVVSVISPAFGSDFELRTMGEYYYTYIAHYSLCFEITLKCMNGDYKEMCDLKAMPNICVVLFGFYNH